jgi:ABC-type multidrug transport system ATPase subunit
MLKLMTEKTGLIVLIILHQPSNEILEAMDSISVMIKGQIVFHQEDMLNFMPEVGPAKYVHQILRDGSSGVTDLTPDFGMEGESVGIKSSCIPLRFSIVQPSVVKSTRRIGLRDNIDIEQQEGNVTSSNVSEYIDRVHYHTLRLRQTSLESSPSTLHADTTRRLKNQVSNAIAFIRQVPQAIAKDFTLLWQVHHCCGECNYLLERHGPISG